jgi:WD40 repeat protein
MTARPLFVPIPIGSYEDSGYPRLDADGEAEKIAALLHQFDPVVVGWEVPPEQRGKDAIEARLEKWSRGSDGADTVLYWVGHGWSNDTTAVLATRLSPANSAARAFSPDDLATYLTGRAGTNVDAWTFAIFDACRSTRFVELLTARLYKDPHGARRILLLGVSGAGSTQLGRFRGHLANCLHNTFHGEARISLADLGRELERELGGTAMRIQLGNSRLVRREPVAPANTPLDVADELHQLLATLAEDEQRHFIPKGQGAEQGELAWYFHGRQREQRQISAWLQGRDTGMLIVTGPPGSGKSALLGQVLTQSRPRLRQVLARHQLLAEAPADQRPGDDVFDTTLLLTGLASTEVVRSLATTADLGEPPVGQDVAAQSDWLIEQIHAAGRPLTMLVDALDEAQQPLVVADRLLRRLATIPAVRVVVGTRRSTHDGPDQPAPSDTNLIDALGRDHHQVAVARDQGAIAGYVSQRLQQALPDLDQHAMALAAQEIADCEGTQFLFARLAVHEIISRPQLLTTEADQRRRLLAGDHKTLFATALERLAAQAPANLALLEALAFSLGRGAPIREGIWADIATAVHPQHAATSEQIDTLLADAAPYLMYDLEDGQTVYRLAHRTYQEHFLQATGGEGIAAGHHRILTTLLAQVTGDQPLDPYRARHLSGHAAQAGMPGWRTLADRPDILDRLDQEALSADAMRTAFGHANLPPEIIGVIGARNHLAAAAPIDRRSLRQLAIARHTPIRTFLPPADTSSWSIRWANLRPHPLHVTLTSHTDCITAVAAFTGSDGRPVLATGSIDETIRIWDAATGEQIGEPLTGHTGGVTAVAAFAGPDGRTLLATGGRDETVRIWDPATGKQTRRRLTGHTHWVAAVAAFSGPDGRTLLATGGGDNTVRIWDPATGEQTRKPPSGRIHRVTAVAVFTGPDGRTLLATGGKDGTVRIWNPATGEQTRRPLSGHIAWVTAVAAFTGPDGRTRLATVGIDGAVRILDPGTGRQASKRLTGHTKSLWAVAAFTDPDGRTLLATGGTDGTVRIWDPGTAKQIRKRLTGHTDTVQAVAAFAGPDGRTLLATGGRDGTVRIWDPAAGKQIGEPLTGHTDWITAVAAFTGPDGRTLLATGGWDGTVRVWDPTTGKQTRKPLSGPTTIVVTVAAFAGPDERTLLATGSWDGTVRVWDPRTGCHVSTIPVGLKPYALCPVDGGIAIGCDSGLLMIDLAPCQDSSGMSRRSSRVPRPPKL